jgi:succinyl-CoA synthetase beta subunit
MLINSSPEAAGKISKRMIGHALVTKQSGPEGKMCNSVMITERKFARKEYYIGIMLDRTAGGAVLLTSSKNGVNIEDVARDSPEDIIMEKINMEEGLSMEQIINVVNKMGIKCNLDSTIKVLQNMYRLFIQKDALLVEINPYVEDICGCCEYPLQSFKISFVNL